MGQKLRTRITFSKVFLQKEAARSNGQMPLKSRQSSCHQRRYKSALLVQYVTLLETAGVLTVDKKHLSEET